MNDEPPRGKVELRSDSLRVRRDGGITRIVDRGDATLRDTTANQGRSNSFVRGDHVICETPADRLRKGGEKHPEVSRRERKTRPPGFWHLFVKDKKNGGRGRGEREWGGEP